MAMITAMNSINQDEKLSQFSEHWSPKVIAELNGQHVKLVKFQGEFVCKRPLRYMVAAGQ